MSHETAATACPSLVDGRPSHTAAVAVHTRWRPPGQGTYKCNVDAVIFKEQNCYGADAVKCMQSGAVSGLEPSNFETDFNYSRSDSHNLLIACSHCES
ncbi:hypothetical protein A2U01_0001171, partial [Trifolium medium]|nr:hypothetical protein [Trifolium medium]